MKGIIKRIGFLLFWAREEIEQTLKFKAKEDAIFHFALYEAEARNSIKAFFSTLTEAQRKKFHEQVRQYTKKGISKDGGL